MRLKTYSLDGDEEISTHYAPKGDELRKLNAEREDEGPSIFDLLGPEPTPPKRARLGMREFFAALEAGESLEEARKKLRGNLCVLTGTGSGGGFVPCNQGSFGRVDRTGLQAHRKATAQKLLDLRQRAKEAIAKGDTPATNALKATMKERGPKALTVALAVQTAKKAAELAALKKANEEAAAKAAAEALAKKAAEDAAKAAAEAAAKLAAEALAKAKARDAEENKAIHGAANILGSNAMDLAYVLPPNMAYKKDKLEAAGKFMMDRAEAAYQGTISYSELKTHVNAQKTLVLSALDSVMGSTNGAKAQVDALKKDLDGYSPDYSTAFGSKVLSAKTFVSSAHENLSAYIAGLSKMKEDIKADKDVDIALMAAHLGSAMSDFKTAVTALAAAKEIKNNAGAAFVTGSAGSAQAAVSNPLTAGGLTVKMSKTGKPSVDPKHLSYATVNAYAKKAAEIAGQSEPPKISPAKLKALAAKVATVDYLKEKGYSSYSKEYKAAKKASAAAIAKAYAGKFGYTKTDLKVKPEDLPKGELLTISGKSAAGKWADVLKKRQSRFLPLDSAMSNGLNPNEKAELVQKAKAWYEGALTYAEKKAVYAYTGSGYSKMNAQLRGKPGYSSPDEETLAAVAAVKKGTGMLPPHTMLYRGQKMVPEIQQAIAAFRAGDRKVTLLKKGLSSASLSSYTAGYFEKGSNLLLRFRDHGTYVAPVSSHETEDEVIIPPGKFRVVNVHSYNGKTVVDLEPMEKPRKMKAATITIAAGPVASDDALAEAKRLAAVSARARFTDNVVDGVEIEPIGNGDDDMPPIEEAATIPTGFLSIFEAKKKIAGNLCVNTGQGSGGGFTACGGTASVASSNKMTDADIAVAKKDAASNLRSFNNLEVKAERFVDNEDGSVTHTATIRATGFAMDGVRKEGYAVSAAGDTATVTKTIVPPVVDSDGAPVVVKPGHYFSYQDDQGDMGALTRISKNEWEGESSQDGEDMPTYSLTHREALVAIGRMTGANASKYVLGSWKPTAETRQKKFMASVGKTFRKTSPSTGAVATMVPQKDGNVLVTLSLNGKKLYHKAMTADDARQTWLNMSEQARARVRALIEAAKKGSGKCKGSCCDSCASGGPCEK